MKSKFFLILILILTIYHTARGQVLNEFEATPSVFSDPDAVFLITEIDFKNSEFDWVKMVYKSSTGVPVNLKKISFADDNAFKTIEEDFVIASEQEILLSFKSSESDTVPYIYSDRKGLTGTTEQFIIYDQNGDIIDAVCWTSSTPTESEIKDLHELFEKEGWNSNNIDSCIPSDDIAAGQPIKRKNLTDTNSINDWQISLNDTADQIIDTSNTDELEVTVLSNPVENDDTEILEPPPIIAIDQEKLPVDESTSKTEATKSSSKSKSTSKTKSSTSKSAATNYRNGDHSTEVVISEIMPNPDGTDTNKEWIELHNHGTETVNLGNWQLDDTEGGSKPYTIPDTISITPNSTVVFASDTTKLSLANKEDQVRLLSLNSELLDSISYEEAPSAESYSLSIIELENGQTSQEWIWTKETTENETNPKFFEFTATIISEPAFDQEYFFYATKKDSEQTVKIVFEEDTVAAPLAKASFATGSIVKIRAKKLEDDNNYLLSSYEVLMSNTNNGTSPLLIPFILFAIALFAVTTFFLLKKKIPWQDIASKSESKLNEIPTKNLQQIK